MAVQVRLDLSDTVSVRDLRTFLNCMPQHVDVNQDLRWGHLDDKTVVYLAAEFPSASVGPVAAIADSQATAS